MRFTRIVVLIALAALTAGSVGSAGTKTIAVSSTPSSGCKILASPVAGPSPTNTVSMKGECYKAGHTILTVVTHSYLQTDYAGAQCGATVSNKSGRSFIPQTKGTFYVSANFKVAPKYKSSGIKPVSTGWVKLQLGHWQTQCGVLNSANLPSAGQLCGYSFTDPANCGQFYNDASTNYPGMVLPPLPQLSGEPKFIDGTIYSAPLASPSGTANCTEFPQGAIFSFLGHPAQLATWQCPGKVVVAPLFTLYYYPPGATTPCWTRPSFEPMVNGLPLGAELSHIVLPNDWQQWGGRMAVLYGAYYYPNDGMNLGGAPKTIAHEYASSWVTFGAQGNACAELNGLGN